MEHEFDSASSEVMSLTEKEQTAASTVHNYVAMTHV